tara:strand:+ start:5646 stop:5807 length:162 start_codon:yes stop_codon:yes gene_type:complete
MATKRTSNRFAENNGLEKEVEFSLIFRLRKEIDELRKYINNLEVELMRLSKKD